jgi:amino acid permease
MDNDDHVFRTQLIRKDSNCFVKKPLPNPVENEDEKKPLRTVISFHSYQSFSPSTDNSVSSSQSLERHLTLTDLCLIGIGGTIGSGLFVLCGLVSNQYAGPATMISWAISGLAACLSGVCYAELSSRIPLAGSAYAYTFVAMGELPAVMAAACLSLEYIAAAAAVS